LEEKADVYFSRLDLEIADRDSTIKLITKVMSSTYARSLNEKNKFDKENFKMKMNYKANVERLLKLIGDEVTFTLPKRQEAVIPYDDLVNCIQLHIHKLPGVICVKDREPTKDGSNVNLSETSEIVLDCLVIDPVDGCFKRPSLIPMFDYYSRWIIGFDISFGAK